MKQRRPIGWLCLTGALLLWATGAKAQQEIERSVIGAGGGYTANSLMAVHATFGQQIIGIVHQNGERVGQGFWYTPTSARVSAVTVQQERPGTGEHVTLMAAPNPFSESTTIRVDLPVAGRISLSLYDAVGRRMLTLLDEDRPAGRNDVELQRGELSSGAYTIVLDGPGVHRTVPLTVVR